ncbi:MAG: NUDIX hydrolase, partial [Verrucomicrobiota bacterium JB023]|nr:NUDIX hydrolase [Verrucomicrobiota bacterium JB023]
MPYTYDYPRPNAAADIILLDDPTSPAAILLIQRKNEPFAGQWAFPGGFIEEDEDPAIAAARELEEETSLSQIKLSPFRFYGDPQRDPRFHCISCVFAGYATPSEVNPKAEDDA